MKRKKDKDEFDERLWISNRAIAITALIVATMALILAWAQLPSEDDAVRCSSEPCTYVSHELSI